MRKYLAAIFLLLMSASIALCIQKLAEWIKYTSAEGRYSVLLPSQPSLTTQQATSADGQKFPQYLASVIEAGDVAFIVAYFDALPGTIFSADAARDGMLKRINGSLISESEITLSGYPGRELKVATNAAATDSTEGTKPARPQYMVYARFYEADKRVYLLQFIFPRRLESEALTAKARKYFDSFQLLKMQQ